MLEFLSNEQDLKFLVKQLGITVFSGLLSNISFDIQENFYGRFNGYKGISSAIGNPNFLTSFAYPLLLMDLLRVACVLGEDQSNRMNHKGREVLFKSIKWLIPVAVVGINTFYEKTVKHAYIDNPESDIWAGVAAAGVFLVREAALEVKGFNKSK